MTSSPKISVLVVDDHVFLRDGIRAIVQSQADMEVVGEAEDGADAVEKFERLQPDVVLMDLQMPVMNGVEAIRRIVAKAPQARIIVLTTYSGDAQALRALKAGACSYLLKSGLRKELFDTIRSVHAGGRHLNAAVAADIAFQVMHDPLTDREVRVLALAAAGNSNKQIADRLDVAEQTVKGHMKTIFAKLDARDRTHAVAMAIKRGVIEL